MAQIITNNSGGGGGGAGVYTYKGSVNSYSDLPSSGLKVGDVYNVINEHTTAPKFPAGSNVAWTGTEWDVLGGNFDLSEYQKKLVEGTGIDIDGDTNEISVDASIVSGAAAGSTAVQPGDLGAVATSNDYDDLDNKPTIPTVNDATLTIQKNSTDVATFTANASSNVTANITVPTDTSDLTNGAGFITNSALSGYQTTANLVTDLTSADDTHYPSALAVKNAITAGGNGDVSGPASSTDGDVVLFDGATGKLIKDSGVNLSSKLDASALSNNNYGGAWENDSTHTPTKGALYTKIHTMDVEIGNKAADNTVVKLTGNQTINGTKTFGTSPVVPSKTSDAANTGTAIATEAQVYKKANKSDVLTKTNTTSYTPSADYHPATKKYVDDNAGTEYNAGEGISIGDITINGRQGPAPDGFHVPSTTEWQGVKTIMDGLSLTTGDNWRINLHMPFAGRRDALDATPTYQESEGEYWSSSPSSASYSYAHYLYLDSSDVDANSSQTRAFGSSVRCFKDSYMTPDSTWTVVQGTLGSAGIFWNQTEGLISITNGTTGYTIMDKNLGATTVYSDGDTLTQANMGNMYQWGNNYGFPSTGTISKTSSTQVDASTYGPTNPYSSDTFITGNNDWSSVQNDNLWGDTTGTITQENVISNTGVLSVNGQTGDVTTHSTIQVTLSSSGWSNNEQTVTATGVTASNTVIVSPAPADIQDYADCGVYGYGQGSGTLTFKCSDTPSGNIVVNVLIFS